MACPWRRRESCAGAAEAPSECKSRREAVDSNDVGKGGGDGGGAGVWFVERLGVWRGSQNYRPIKLGYMTEDRRRRLTTASLSFAVSSLLARGRIFDDRVCRALRWVAEDC